MAAAAVRWLQHACPAGAFPHAVDLAMTGRIKVGLWLPFRALQRVDTTGFRWSARVGWGPATITGHDAYRAGAGAMSWRLAGLVPLAHASGADVSRSAAWRFGAEALTWLPGPRPRLTLEPAGEHRLDARLPVGPELVTVTLHLHPSGAVRAVSGLRWGNPDHRGFQYHRFGVDVLAEDEFDGIRVPSEISASWWWGTPRQAEGEFFRARITSARYT